MAEHYFSQKQNSELRRQKITSELRGKKIELYTASGVFSIKKVDKGSELLINNCLIEEGWRVLDLGCGYGAVGIALKKAEPSIKIAFTDVNERAVMLTKENLRLNRIEGDVRRGDGLKKVSGEYDTILLNPPQTAGRDVCLRLIRDSKDHLVEGGLLQIVARHKKGGETLSRYMEQVYGNVETIAKGSGYRVYISRKEAD